MSICGHQYSALCLLHYSLGVLEKVHQTGQRSTAQKMFPKRKSGHHHVVVAAGDLDQYSSGVRALQRLYASLTWTLLRTLDPRHALEAS
jgi:16S rRNA U516 pseudouridylate synthase RsuA-like enzyme